jgi:glucose-6-phosphate isomerase
MTIRLDYTNMLADVVKGGVPMAEWEKATKGFAATQGKFDALRATGNLGFLELPQAPAVKAITTYRDSVRGKFDDIVVLGIGGSALGPIALRTALRAPNWNSLSDKERDGNPRMHVLDNVDPRTIDALLKRLDLKRSLFIVTSKSGGTAETMAQ